MVTELRLASGALEKHYELAGDRERHVHAGGDAGGGVKVAVPGVDGVVADPVADQLVQLFQIRPVRGRPTPLEEPAGGKYQRSGAHRAESRDASGHAGQPREELCVPAGGGLPAAAGDQQGVRTCDLAIRALGHEPHTRGSRESAGAQRHHLDAVSEIAADSVVLHPARGTAEYLERPRDIEDLHVGVSHHHHMMRPSPGRRSAGTHRAVTALLCASGVALSNVKGVIEPSWVVRLPEIRAAVRVPENSTEPRSE